jgi:hypothetical protein
MGADSLVLIGYLAEPYHIDPICWPDLSQLLKSPKSNLNSDAFLSALKYLPKSSISFIRNTQNSTLLCSA